jgi:nitroreductase
MTSSNPVSDPGEVLGQLLRTRYSARSFRPDPVPDATIRQILDQARHTPSWCNTQPWTVHLLRGQALQRVSGMLHAVAAEGAPARPDFAFPERYPDDHRARRRACGLSLYQALGIGREDREAAARQTLENFRFFDAPHAALITTPASLGVYGAIDCGLYLQSWMLAARAAGVDTIAQAAVASYPDLVRECLGLPADQWLVFGIAFGYAREDHPVNRWRTERVELPAVLPWVAD